MYGVTRYDVMTLPPLAGAVHDTDAEPDADVDATTLVGAAGAVLADCEVVNTGSTQ